MYNRYIPAQNRYETVKNEAFTGRKEEFERRAGGQWKPFGGAFGKEQTEGIGQAVSALLKRFHLEDIDTGDILLGLIILFLILEDGDNLDLIITLGLMILFSLGEP